MQRCESKRAILSPIDECVAFHTNALSQMETHNRPPESSMSEPLVWSHSRTMMGFGELMDILKQFPTESLIVTELVISILPAPVIFIFFSRIL